MPSLPLGDTAFASHLPLGQRLDQSTREIQLAVGARVVFALPILMVDVASFMSPQSRATAAPHSDPRADQGCDNGAHESRGGFDEAHRLLGLDPRPLNLRLLRLASL